MSNFNSFRIAGIKRPDKYYIMPAKFNNVIWRGEIKDVPWRRTTKGHRLVHSITTPFFVGAFRDHAKIGDLAFLPRRRAGEVTRPLFTEKFNFTPRPALPTSRYPSWIFIATWLCFRFDGKCRIRAENGIQTEYTKLARNSRSVIKFTEHRVGHLPGRSLIIDDGLMHPSHFIQDVCRASTTQEDILDRCFARIK